MHWLAFTLIVLLFAGFGVFGAWLGFREKKTWSTAAAIAGIGVIGLRILLRLRPDIEYNLLPFDWYVSIRPWWAFPAALLAAGIGAARMSTRTARIGVGVFGVLLLLVPAQHLFLTYRMTADEYTGVPDAEGICLQSTDFSCGAAAAATVLAQLGVPATEREMAGLCGTNAFTGTDEFGVARGLRKKLEGKNKTVDVVKGDWERMKKGPFPAAATIKFEFMTDHWVVILKVDGERVVVGDPVKGRHVMKKAEFLSRWRGVLVIVER